MEFLKKFNLKQDSLFKIIGVGILGIVLIALGLSLLKIVIGPLLFNGSNVMPGISRQAMPALDTKSYAEESGEMMAMGGEMDLSMRNITPSPEDPVILGDDAEDFEVTEYTGTIETRHLEDTCKTISDLKSKDYVIFENSNIYDYGCNYRFKVKKDNAEEILKVIEELDLKDLSKNVRTIKKLVEDFIGELEILESKRKSIDETLENAIDAYDEITDVAAKTRDAETLAKIIDSKIRIIERLTRERINVNSQIERLSRSKAEQLDRLEYTYFNILVFENKFVDKEAIKDSWKREIKGFVNNVNRVAQDISINLIGLLFFIAQYIIYIFVVLIIGKYVWRVGKYIWKR